MNAILIVLLCSVACCFASPTCSEREMQKCGSFPDSIVTEEDIGKFCKKMRCYLDVYEKCGLDKDKETRIAYLTYKRSYDVTCDVSNPLREKLIRNLRCLNDVSKFEEIKECRKIVHDVPDHRDYCRRINRSLECLYDLVYKTCGRDAKEAFAAAYPDAELFGCP